MTTTLYRATLASACIAILAGSQTPSSQAQLPVTPPRLGNAETALTQKSWEQLSDKQISDWGKAALASQPDAWKHGETPTFVVHFQNPSMGQKAARMAEYCYNRVKFDLGLTQDMYKEKNHLYLFSDNPGWEFFCDKIKKDGKSLSSIQKGSELFVKPAGSKEDDLNLVLGFPTTVCAFKRFFSNPPPKWVVTGIGHVETKYLFAERKGMSNARANRQLVHPQSGSHMNLRNIVGISNDSISPNSPGPAGGTQPLKLVMRINDGPESPTYHEDCGVVVEMLLSKLNRQQFIPLVTKLSNGTPFDQAIVECYPDKFKNFEAFELFYNANWSSVLSGNTAKPVSIR